VRIREDTSLIGAVSAMDQETIQKIAAEVVKHLPNYPLALLAVQTVLMLIAAALGAFLSEYLKTRGKHLATKADFDTLESQLRANTELVEGVKADVAQKDWAKREWTNLRRVKLEDLLNELHECEQYADRRRTRALEGKGAEEGDHDPAQKLQTLGILYFPQLSKQIGDYLAVHRNLMVATIKLAQDVSRSGGHQPAYGEATAEFKSSWNHYLPRSLTLAHELRTAARSIMVKIVGIED
jgi:hypothetical protein